AWNEKGDALYDLKKYEDAIHCYDTILQIKPKRADVWLRKAFALRKLGKYQDAIDSFDKALKIDAKFSRAWEGKGDALCELGKYEDAINCYDKALQARPGSITGRGFFKRITLRKQDEDDAWFLKFWLSNIWCKKAQALAKLGKYEDAIDCYDKAIEIDPDGRLAQREKEDTEKQIKILAVSSKVEQLQDKCVIPQSIHAQIKLFEEGDHEIDIESLESLLDQVENTTPQLELMLKHKHLTVNRWDQLELEIRNTSIAHAFNLIPSFSDEIEMRRIKAVTVKGQQSITLELGAKAKIGGRIPVDIKLEFEDSKGNKHEQIHEEWIEVREDAKAPISSEEEIRWAQLTPRPDSALPPGLAENYHDIQLIGQGGFARVFKAVRVRDNKEVAIKIPVSLDQATGKTFIEEIKNWTRLNHPNIVKIYDYNVLPIPFFEMELCDSSLDQYIKDNKDKRIQLNNACWIVFNAAEGLKSAHSLKIIHRDLKPQNILLKDGIPKLTDWGLSKVITESAGLSGFTPPYAAPEQISGKQKDERTDIWQLAVIFYQITTGKLPFEGEDIAMSIVTKEPVRPSELNPEIDPELEEIILKPISKDPKGRYQSVREFQMALAKHLRISVKEELSKAVSAKDFSKSAYYCADLLLVCLKINDGVNAYKYIDDLINYAKGDTKDELIALKDGIERRVKQKDPIPAEIVNQADILVHKVKIGGNR
ncbi:tetratricopeptide repeat protein, partial [Dehalococcoidia bacterium]|nr:tetratricopeptide repeat protein [Dehalococcoidia bacterium]